MGTLFKIILVLLGLAYLISPVDIIPEMLVPFLGWVDDGLVLYCIYYLIRHGQLPWFFFKRSTGAGYDREPAGHNRSTTGFQTTDNGSGQKTGDDANRSKPGPNGSHSRTTKTAHEILGVPMDASWEEIQAAYKQQIKKYHPDKLSHLGKEFSDLASRRFLEIQKAFETLKARKGR
ncbi:MAG: DnaJ domain-containing protein [Desulfotignum sp.]|nr:DnaJ domain-containing protein [Desulfobacteraceae bacterium]